MGSNRKIYKHYKIYTLAKKFRNNDDVADIIKKYAQSGRIDRVMDIRVPGNLHKYLFPVNSLETTKEFVESLGLKYEYQISFQIYPNYNVDTYINSLKMDYGSRTSLTKQYPGKVWDRTLILGEYVDEDFSNILARYIDSRFSKINFYKVKFYIIKLESSEPVKLYSLSFKGRTDIDVYSLIDRNEIDCIIDTRTIKTIQEQESMEESLDDYVEILRKTAKYEYYHLKKYIWSHLRELEQYTVNRRAIFNFVRSNYSIFWNKKKVAVIGEFDDKNDYGYMYAETFARIMRLIYLDVKVEKL